jgi:hypothetical protein
MDTTMYVRPGIESRQPITNPLIGFPASGTPVASAAFRHSVYLPPHIAQHTSI